MIGLILIMYVFPATIMFSLTNICFISIELAIINGRYNDLKNIKPILMVTSVIITFITLLVIRLMKILDTPLNKDFALPVSYSISIIIALYLFKLRSISNSVFTNQ